MQRLAIRTILAATTLFLAVLAIRFAGEDEAVAPRAVELAPRGVYLMPEETVRLAATLRPTGGVERAGYAADGVGGTGDLDAAGAHDRAAAAGSLAARGQATDAPLVAWASSDPTIARVDADGIVTALRHGTATISAGAGGAADSTRITVGPAVLVGAGDIAICRSDAHEATAALLDSIPGLVVTLGDHAYGDGTADEFEDCYDRSWGRHRHRTRPSVGNHDFRTDSAAPYFEYFGANAGEPGKGYYSYELGDWHVVVLNSEIDTGENSPQLRWLRRDLAEHPARCTVAYWHRPLFSSGRYERPRRIEPIWDALYEAGADVVLNGHDHAYEQFVPQTPDGEPDPERGIRQFIVGTGGAGLYTQGVPLPTSEVRQAASYGVLKLELEPAGYAWKFVPVPGGRFTTAGRGLCHD